MNEITHFKIESKADGLLLGATLVSPERPKGILQISHGMSEFRGRFLDFQQYLADNGWASVIHDHRGHGESVKSEEDFGYFYENGAAAVVEDLHQITLWAKDKLPGLPLVLLGHSMGSLIVRVYAGKYDGELDGLIVCASPGRNRFAPLAGAFLGKRSHRRPALVQKRAFGSFAERFEGESENRWLCSDPGVVEFYDGDPRCGFTFTANGFKTLFKLMTQCYSKSVKADKPGLPVLFIAGAEDPVLLGTKNFEKAVQNFRARGYGDVTAKLYPGMRHEILNERGKAEVYADVLNFCEVVGESAK